MFTFSVGKSTVLNALLGDKFSEVSMKRTTAGVNYFRVFQPNCDTRASTSESAESEASLSRPWIECDPPTKLAESTHKEIADDNKVLRSSSTVSEKFFDIQVNEPICTMRKDTQLVLVDIPGINEVRKLLSMLITLSTV
jgi:GTPase SAR1 family protein